MSNSNNQSNTNDYPVARALNGALLTIFKALRSDDGDYVADNHKSMVELNRHYVLMVHELERLYGNNTELDTIKPEPFWRRYDVLETVSEEILDYLEEPDVDRGQAHIIKLNKLCIIYDNEIAKLNSKQKKLVEGIEDAVGDYKSSLNGAMDAVHLPIMASETDYILSYKDDGRIMINDAIELKKTQIGSAIDELLEQAFKNEYKLFIPHLKNTARNYSTILSSAGFTPELRKLFFPTVSKTKGIMFRPVVARSVAKSENIDTRLLDLLLTKLGAYGIFKDLEL